MLRSLAWRLGTDVSGQPENPVTIEINEIHNNKLNAIITGLYTFITTADVTTL
jgi:hypothetical protein